MKMPISIRLTSSTGKQVTLTNVYTSWSAMGLIDTGKDYNTKRSVDMEMDMEMEMEMDMDMEMEMDAEMEMPEVEAEAEVFDEATPVLVTVFSTASPSYFAVQVSSVDDVASVELMDSATLSSYAFMTFHKWGYGLEAPEGTTFVAPLTVRVTNSAGNSVTAAIDSFTPHLAAFADGAL